MDDPRREQDRGPRVDPAALALLRDAYREAMLRGTASAAERVIAEAMDAGLSEALIGDEIIAPAMYDVGERWAAGELSVEDEHVASGITMRMISLQRDHFRVQHRRSSQRVLLAAVEGEEHVLGLEMAASVLLHAGYDVRMLGPDVATADIAAEVLRQRPAILGLTTTTPDSAERVAGAIAAARSAAPELAVMVGGGATHHLPATGPHTVVCPHVSDAVGLADALTQRSGLN
ncbi:MAG TPA: cobalamin-dependent protein [Solirubrobacteraceae bacterium]